jgi:glycerate 2-kinase
MVEIRNIEGLVDNAESSTDREARRIALVGLKAALDAADPRQLIKSRVTLRGNQLRIDERSFDLQKSENVYVVGGGKASGAMAEAMEAVLGDHITGGAINVPYQSGPYAVSRIRLQEASHPVPDESGVKGTRQILDVARHADENDLIICLISGGGSSLMPLPRRDISLSNKKLVTEALLNSGAPINEINTVRKHLSDFKGGWLAKSAYPAIVINLILSDVLGDPLDFIASGPSVPDSTTFQEAIEVLEKYKLWNDMPESVKNVLLDGRNGLLEETPKKDDKAFQKVHNFIVGNNRLATLAAHTELRSIGLNTLYLTSYLEGEARHVGTVLAAIAREIAATGNPVARPAAVVVGGETTVSVVGQGAGGRNQEIALGAALKIQGMRGVAIGSASTDGVDGPTDAAGALVDGRTIRRSKSLGLNAEQFLMDNNSYALFSELGDLIFTGPTGTNVNDVSIIVVL